MTPAMYGPGGRVPLKPFCGTIGLAPAEAGQHSVVPPRRVGGNMDIRDISAGTELYLPVEVKGGLFSVGDHHAAQGDGEVCGTAIESPLLAGARFDVVKGANLPFPRFTTAGPVTPAFRREGLRGDDRHRPRPHAVGARAAVSGMVELLAKRTT
jgi:acetamidase/formamidase